MRTRTGRSVVLVLGMVMALGLAACAGTATPGSGPAASIADDGWVAFGPFQKPAVFAGDKGVTGPGNIRIPNVGVVRLDAESFLPGMAGFARDMEIESQQYTYAYDGTEPIIVAVVQVAEKLHFRRHVETRHSTYVLGLSAESDPRVLTTWAAYKKGAVHTVSLTGLSDQGVVVIFLEGMHDGVNDGTRLDGIDVVRGTDVWWRTQGYPGEGGGAPTFYTATAPDACATEVEEYQIASGAAVHTQDIPDAGAGGTCRRADDDSHRRQHRP
jgi:hypothetical protein